MINTEKLAYELSQLPTEGVDSDGNIHWAEEPTKEQLTLAQSIIDSHTETWYVEDRLKAYPPIGDQLDMLWHAIDGGKFGDLAKTTEFYTAIKQVKTDYPKESVITL